MKIKVELKNTKTVSLENKTDTIKFIEKWWNK